MNTLSRQQCLIRIGLVVALFLGVFSCRIKPHSPIHVFSPDRTIRLDLSLDDGFPSYAVQVDGQPLIAASTLGFRFRGLPDMLGPFELLDSGTQMVEETWEPVWGQEDRIQSLSRSIELALKEQETPFRTLNLTFRVFDDGIAFRYEIPEQAGLDSLFILDEGSEFNLAEDGQAWWIPGSHAFDSYEQLHKVTPISEVDSANTPFTCKTENGYYLSIHEANLTDYAGFTLKRSVEPGLVFRTNLVPWPDGDKVKTRTPMRSPWRTITIGRSATDLLASRLILNLNEPNRLEDVSFIRPMKYMGIWWGMHINKYTWVQGEKHGATTENVKTYIDFAAENNIQGVLAEGWNVGWEDWGKPGALNLIQPYDDFDLESILAYARERGVAFIGHHETTADVAGYEAQLDTAFAYYAGLGIHALKTGYVGAIRPEGQLHYGQWMVNHFRRVTELAARHGIMLDVHEPIKGTGIERTWPNLMTREGARGQEWNAWSEGNPPSHTTILPFTRLLAGPMDYTPGIFDLHFDRYKEGNRVQSTLAKELALMVVLYSPLQMAADLPENYAGHPAFQFIRDLEVDWDESRYLAAEIGEYVAVARRNHETWYLGAITNQDERVLSLPLAGMITEQAALECYVDGPGADWDTNPLQIHLGTYLADPEDVLKVKLAPGGGVAVRIRPALETDLGRPTIQQLITDQD